MDYILSRNIRTFDNLDLNTTTLTQNCFWIQGANIDSRIAQKNCRRGEKQFQDSIPKKLFKKSMRNFSESSRTCLEN